MTESEHEDVADALARMAGGDAVPDEHEAEPPAFEKAPAESSTIDPDMPPAMSLPPRVVRPATARPVGPGPDSQGPGQSPPPRPVRPAAPVSGDAAAQPPIAVPTSIPAAPPAAPPIAASDFQPASMPAAARRLRPSAPTLRNPAAVSSDNTAKTDSAPSSELSSFTGDVQIGDVQITDDDSVIIPASEPSAFTPRQKPISTAQARAAVNARKNLEFRRTLIPILLTCSGVMFVFGLLKFVTGEDSMLANLPVWVPIALFIAAAILIGLAAVNMLSVKQQLAQSRPVI